MKDPTCVGGGWVVGMEESLPWDRADYYSPGGRLVGCNRIQCRDCGEWVRHFDKCAYTAANLSRDQCPKLYEAKDPLQFKFMYADEDSRVYTCKCAFTKTQGGRSLDTLDLPNWYCGGHPQS